MKSLSRPGNRVRAKPNATSMLTTVSPTIVVRVTMVEFFTQCRKGPASHISG
jgi:hypothetical protein